MLSTFPSYFYIVFINTIISIVTISDGFIFFIFASLTDCLPASLAYANRSGLVAGIRALPGSANPSASAIICNVEAVPINEHLQPGDKLPNEAHLAKELNIGRSSLREAMKLLAPRNIVTIRQGSGTYVASSPGVVDDPLGFTFIPDKKACPGSA